ncbi:PAS domain S-box protein [Cohnella faecalis]|uniref:Oxygen sensor histidine kinase NreB n=1 Tax=Cohnella faecalis TaxID=2315694 RepID=A0A398CW47_9BACL|nr:PAS domain S-box protein [Cohnella faecalis]RIE03431.1 PAS domain S-box protein [Cohnella faecalis]
MSDTASLNPFGPESSAAHVASLLAEFDAQVEDEAIRVRLKNSLKQLVDVKLALDEASIVAVTDRKGKIQYVNDKFCAISGYGRDELLGEDHRIINSGHHDKSFMRELWSTISSGRVWRGDIKNRAKDGRYYWVNTTIVPFVGDGGEPYQYLAIRHEVTRLKETEEELQTMVSQIMHIQEEQRKQFSRDLHDGIGQSLFSLKISLDRMISDNDSPDLNALRQDVTQLMTEVRGLAWEMRPSVLDDLGVVPALRTYTEHISRYYGIHVRFDSELSARPPLSAETTIYRVVQEALTNIGKYARASEAVVALRERDDLIEAVVSDDGIGFNKESKGSGVGLFGMEERARAVSGELSIVSSPGQGTTVKLVIPVVKR